MKKIAVAMLTIMMILSLAACAGAEEKAEMPEKVSGIFSDTLSFLYNSKCKG